MSTLLTTNGLHSSYNQFRNYSL